MYEQQISTIKGWGELSEIGALIHIYIYIDTDIYIYILNKQKQATESVYWRQ